MSSSVYLQSSMIPQQFSIPTKAEAVAPRLEPGILQKIFGLFSRISAPAAPAAEKACSKPEEISEAAQRDGVIWNCIGRKADGPGFIYEFKLRAKYDDVTGSGNLKDRGNAAKDKMDEAFPAVEDYGSNVLFLDPQVQLKDLSPDTRSLRAHLFDFLALGYRAEKRDDGVYLYLPDGEALQARWKSLRTMRPQLPPLKILASQAIADDLSFVRAYFTHDVLISSGKEFIHDQLAHVIPTLTLILFADAQNQTSAYGRERSHLAALFGKAYRRTMIAKILLENNSLNIPKDELRLLRLHLPKIEATLGALVDVVSSMGSFEETSEVDNATVYSQNFFFRSWENPKWKVYYEHRFGAQNINRDELEAVWKLMEDCKTRFDSTRCR